MNANPFRISPRDILPGLLAKLLEARLGRLEKRNAIEAKELQCIKRIANDNCATLSKCIGVLSKTKSKSFSSNTHSTSPDQFNKTHKPRIPIWKRTHIKLNLFNITTLNQRPLTPTPQSNNNHRSHMNVLKKNSSNIKTKKKYSNVNTNSGNKHSNLSDMSYDHLKSKSTSSKPQKEQHTPIKNANRTINKSRLRNNFSGVIGQVSQDNDELLIGINTDLFTRNSILPMSVLFSFHQLFDNKFTLLKFLSNAELMKFALINKAYGRIFLNEYIGRIDNELKEIASLIDKQKMHQYPKQHQHQLHQSKDQYLQQGRLTFSNKAIKAVELLDEDSYLEIFKLKKPPPTSNDTTNTTYTNGVLFMYYLLLNMFNSSMTIDPIIQSYHNKPISLFWNKLTEYIHSKANSQFGSFIMRKLNQFDYNKEHLDKIYNIAAHNYSLINPSNYTKVCPTTALVTFIVKDFLDYFNISNDMLSLTDKQIKYSGLLQRMVNIKKTIYNIN